MTASTSRRTLLLSGLGAGVLAVARPWRTFLEWERSSALDRLLLLLRADDATMRVGRAYLRSFPDHADEDLLVDMITRSLGASVTAPPSELARRAVSAIDAELRAIDTVRLDGWIAAPTEGRLAALATLARTPAPER